MDGIQLQGPECTEGRIEETYNFNCNSCWHGEVLDEADPGHDLLKSLRWHITYGAEETQVDIAVARNLGNPQESSVFSSA